MKIQKTYLGPPGTGKTQNNSNLIREYIRQGIEPERIAGVSFTRKAARESCERVCRDTGLEGARRYRGKRCSEGLRTTICTIPR